MSENELRLLAITVPVLVAIVVGFYKAAGIRAQHNRTWSRRIRINDVILEDVALNILRDIYFHVGRHIDHDMEFRRDISPLDPTSPAPMLDKYSKILRFRRRMSRDFKRLMLIGPAFLVTLALGGICVALITIDGIGLLNFVILVRLTYLLGPIAVALLVLSLMLNVVLQHRLTSTELFCQRQMNEPRS